MKLIIYLVFGLGLSYSACAQLSISEMAAAPESEYIKNIFINYDVSNYSKLIRKEVIDPRVLFPRRIGLIAFNHFETDHKREKSLIAYQYQNDGLTIIQRIFNDSKKAIIDSLAQHDITLLSLDDFDEAQLAAYKKAQSEIAQHYDRKVDLYKTLEKADISVCPTPFNFIPSFYNEGKDKVLNDILGNLCEELGLDGLLSIQLTTNTFNYSIAFTNAMLSLNIPDPDPDRKVTGTQLAGYFYLTQSPVGFIGLKKGEVTGEDLSGFDKLLARMSGDVFRMLSLEQELYMDN